MPSEAQAQYYSSLRFRDRIARDIRWDFSVDLGQEEGHKPFIWRRRPEPPALYTQMSICRRSTAVGPRIAISVSAAQPARARRHAPPVVGAGARVALEERGSGVALVEAGVEPEY